MKRITFIYIIALVLFSSGCKKFLDLPPKNQRAVETLEDVKSSLAGYLDGVKTKYMRPIVGAYPIYTARQIMMFESFSDNIDFKANISKFINSKNMHAKEEFYANMLLWNPYGLYDVPTEIWNKYYEAVGFLNALIDKTKTLKTANADELNRVLGEMLVHRSFYLFKLLQYFAPYDKMDLGIPVYLHSGDQVVGVSMPRKPQNEVYKIIIDDLKESLKLIQQSPARKSFNVFYNDRYINNLLAQVYWFKAESAAKEVTDYKDAKSYSQEAIMDVAGTIPNTTAEINLTARGTNLDYPAFYQTGNGYAEVSPIYGSTWDYLGYQPAGITLPTDLLNLFSANDIRTAAYFTGNAISSSWPDGAAYGARYAHFYMFQPEEAYLILAEAQFRLNEIGGAVATLNQFKSFRNAGNADGLSGDQLLQEIVNERRKEFFSSSDKRWLDLKRYGMKTLNRSLRFFNKDYSVIVAPNDFHYALPIPLTELQNNPLIIQNEGWVPIVF